MLRPAAAALLPPTPLLLLLLACACGGRVLCCSTITTIIIVSSSSTRAPKGCDNSCNVCRIEVGHKSSSRSSSSCMSGVRDIIMIIEHRLDLPSSAVLLEHALPLLLLQLLLLLLLLLFFVMQQALIPSVKSLFLLLCAFVPTAYGQAETLSLLLLVSHELRPFSICEVPKGIIADVRGRRRALRALSLLLLLLLLLLLAIVASKVNELGIRCQIIQ
jgi:hypothetical protein